MNDATQAEQKTKPEIKPDLVEAKQRLEIEKLQLEMKFIRRNHYAQVLNTIGIIVVGLVVFYFFQRPQIEQMETSRLATEKQKVAEIAMSALALENPQDRASMLNAIHAMNPQYEFLGSLVRSQTLLAQVAAASPPAVPPVPPPAPPAEREIQQSPPPQVRPPISSESDAIDRARTKRAALEELESHLPEIDERCRKANDETNSLERILRELLEMTDKELAGSASSRKPGRGAAYYSLYEQTTKVKAQLASSRNQAATFCSQLEAIKVQMEGITKGA